ncbi:MAG: hypothetical protein WBC93_19595 [Sulfitobacter sp.]
MKDTPRITTVNVYVDECKALIELGYSPADLAELGFADAIIQQAVREAMEGE